MRIRTAVAAALIATTGACSTGYAPTSGQQILDDLTAAELLVCEDTRSPVDDVITCILDAEDPGDNDVTIGLTDDGPARTQRLTGDGPHLIGETWVVLTFNGDIDRIERMQEALGDGDIYVRNDEGDLAPR